MDDPKSNHHFDPQSCDWVHCRFLLFPEIITDELKSALKRTSIFSKMDSTVAHDILLRSLPKSSPPESWKICP
ncbi:WD repeat-containing protein dyf-2 [Frankliniella fusca]|uniref:WD repeat-containing protein dyf-2 n=1 Tax=Frankliniella fusca TaxID=407009 RepID=A0AAE1HRN7_9NEOP|nr:WD repeat-containing protein dyf-2 [Frankliniella fusca]